jgi:hypothetical protein
VILGIVVNDSGRVVDANVVESNNPDFNDSAAGRTMNWLFKVPSSGSDKANMVYTVQYVDFKNRDKMLIRR